LILLFTLLPLVELSLLLRIGQWLGAGATLGLVIGTGIVGAWLARREGLRSWAAVNRELGQGRLPGDELMHAFLVLIAGVVLVTPGVLTDAAGLVLLVHPAREWVVARARKRLAGRMQVHTVGFGPSGMEGFGTGSGHPGDKADGQEEGGRIIEV
jgi:UPF0716 protein FxsA